MLHLPNALTRHLSPTKAAITNHKHSHPPSKSEFHRRFTIQVNLSSTPHRPVIPTGAPQDPVPEKTEQREAERPRECIPHHCCFREFSRHITISQSSRPKRRKTLSQRRLSGAKRRDPENVSRTIAASGNSLDTPP